MNGSRRRTGGRKKRAGQVWRVAAFLAGCLAAASSVADDFAREARRYVQDALARNLSLRGQSVGVEQSAAALDTARAHYLPELSLNARYTRAAGGREIEFPIGQLLNPAYQTLNQLLAAQGQPPRFPPIEDQAFAFQRAREQDTRISLRQPLYEPAIPAAVSAQRALLSADEYAKLAFARSLQRDVTTAYAAWLQARRVRDLLSAQAELLDENLRVAESLRRNGRITQDQVLRARAERLAVVQQQQEALARESATRRYVNFLRNRPEDTALQDLADDEVGDGAEDIGEDAGTVLRPELERIDRLQQAADAKVDFARSARKPKLALGIDAGTQGEQYRLGSGFNYLAASLVLTWKFFDGGASRGEIDQARLVARQLGTQREEAAARIGLEVAQARDAYAVARSSLLTAIARDAAAAEALRIAGRQRDEGVLPQTSFLEIRTARVAAADNLIATRFALRARRADLEFATGGGELPPATEISP
ncbi:MAG: hypothetical protein RLZZ200_2319 [Pseudomonadota bacterium]|jgi:outer membrane protein TolC